MSGPYVVPIEAVKAGATAFGERVLSALDDTKATLQEHATVELAPTGWLATVVYQPLGMPARRLATHVPLVWTTRPGARA